MPDTVPPALALAPVASVDALVAQALRLLTAAHALAQGACAGYNVEGLDEAAGACREWLTAREEG